MTHVTPTENSDHLDMISHGNQDDTVIGLGGNDLIAGWDGDDDLHGKAGNDELWGEGGKDKLYGGTGVDQLYGDAAYLGVEGDDPNGADCFYFMDKDTGDILDGQADTIHDFETQDKIFIKGDYEYNAGGGWTPPTGDFSIWSKGSDWVVTWNSPNDTDWNDVLVKGDKPTQDDIFFY
jgi:Ca2+-binding RTX toxin-like protein